MAPAPTLVLGIGSTMRRDDGVGPRVASLVREKLGASEAVEVRVLDGESARVVDAWQGRELAVLVDAVRRGVAPGAAHRVELNDDLRPTLPGGPSSHSGGLSEAIALGRVLGRLPDRLVIFGIEPADLSLGESLSAPVAAAIPALVDSVLHEVRG